MPLACDMKTKLSCRRPAGFTLTELLIVVAIIALLTTLAVPNLARARDNSRLNLIYSNLRALDSAKDQWAIDNNKPSGTPMDDMGLLRDYFRGRTIHDVLGETYVPNPIGTPAQANLPPGVSLGPFGAGAAIAAR